jgi:hypothetical protein
MAMHKKSFNIDVNENLSDEFSAQVTKRGYTKYRAIEGALRAFMALSPAEQVKWMSAGNSAQQSQPAKSEDPAEEAANLARYCLKKYQGLSKKDFAISLKFLSDEESRAVKEMLAAINPESRYEKNKKKKAGG